MAVMCFIVSLTIKKSKTPKISYPNDKLIFILFFIMVFIVIYIYIYLLFLKVLVLKTEVVEITLCLEGNGRKLYKFVTWAGYNLFVQKL